MFRFTAYDSDPALTKFLDNHTPVESLVTLKVGAQVMLLKNLNVSLINVASTLLSVSMLSFSERFLAIGIEN